MGEGNMNATAYCKSKGIKMSEVAEMTGMYRYTLERWYDKRERLFVIIVKGCMKDRRDSDGIC